tara:strand:- start:18513 stop:20159 length:1647 start_codon:yes stop_codon:yes gene_type:complete
MKKKYQTLILVLSVVLSSYISLSYSDNYFETSKNIDIFTSLYKELNTYYVDRTDPGILMKEAIDAMLKSLDPYTQYIPESEIEDFRLQTTGQYGGIGAMITKIEDYVVISEPYEGFPAQKAGLLPGDRIIEINGVNAKGKSTEDVSKILRGQPNTSVTLLINRPHVEQSFKVSFNREKVFVPSVPYSAYISDGIGYVRLNSFTKNCANNVKSSIMELKNEQNLEGLILDLRGNPGGLLNESVEIVNLFIEKGVEVVNTKGKIKSWDKSYVASKNPLDIDVPLVVLINSASASASEIVSGAIQDLDRGVIIGQRSFGKGLVQQTRKLPYNSQLKLTVAKYYIPSGRCIQALDYSNRNEDGSVGKITDSLMTTFYTKNGREVKDGGGILPDIVLDTENYSMIIASLYRERLFFHYANYFRFLNDTITDDFIFSDLDYSNFTEYLLDKDYSYKTETEKSLENFKKESEQEGYFIDLSNEYSILQRKLMEKKQDDLIKSKEDIQEILTMEIMSRYYFQKGRIKASINFDIEIKKAIELLQDPQKYDNILSRK